MPFPVIKLVGIVIKQASKPLAAYIKRQAKGSYWFRTYICMPPAQWYHRMDVRARMWTSNTKRSEGFKIVPLSEDLAIDTGADMLGEIVVFAVAAGVLYLEYWRQNVNNAKREKKQDATLVKLRKDVDRLTEILDNQSQAVNKLTELIEQLDGKNFRVVKVDLEPSRIPKR